jgi:carboxypeptidase Taq
MGNLLSYQIWNRMLQDVPDADKQMARGEFGSILGWLVENLYRLGKSVPPKELAVRLTGKPMGADDYIAGIEAKYRALYGI